MMAGDDSTLRPPRRSKPSGGCRDGHRAILARDTQDVDPLDGGEGTDGVGEHVAHREAATAALACGAAAPADLGEGAGAVVDGGAHLAVGDGSAVADDHVLVPPGLGRSL